MAHKLLAAIGKNKSPESMKNVSENGRHISFKRHKPSCTESNNW